ncbi:uncharacterized protein BDZ99DRAFT_577044 [Mytilinidion resinicola]|uniref:Uncharacterized protein n=1 Tax=Mytilinidion resinicola TaxID=574789 RepID=A0A6A6Y082_9PEZI|nr:uncharacterized protein BDZ99DRAFT_577044 [Mytilinidion resinicola]KAF2802059.1 hypothetical protein BDZ99DRAFT_577044 [Mytilinidion resinicola]
MASHRQDQPNAGDARPKTRNAEDLSTGASLVATVDSSLKSDAPKEKLPVHQVASEKKPGLEAPHTASFHRQLHSQSQRSDTNMPYSIVRWLLETPEEEYWGYQWTLWEV